MRDVTSWEKLLQKVPQIFEIFQSTFDLYILRIHCDEVQHILWHKYIWIYYLMPTDSDVLLTCNPGFVHNFLAINFFLKNLVEIFWWNGRLNSSPILWNLRRTFNLLITGSESRFLCGIWTVINNIPIIDFIHMIGLIKSLRLHRAITNAWLSGRLGAFNSSSPSQQI